MSRLVLKIEIEGELHRPIRRSLDRLIKLPLFEINNFHGWHHLVTSRLIVWNCILRSFRSGSYEASRAKSRCTIFHSRIHNYTRRRSRRVCCECAGVSGNSPGGINYRSAIYCPKFSRLVRVVECRVSSPFSHFLSIERETYCFPYYFHDVRSGIVEWTL